ncbi:hypothetical protein ADUPG1_005045, partial [Aduncisulcus paluster]
PTCKSIKKGADLKLYRDIKSSGNASIPKLEICIPQQRPRFFAPYHSPS